MLWDHNVGADGGSSFHGSMLIEGDRLYVGTDGDAGFLYAFDLAGATVAWKRGIGHKASSDILGGNGLVYAASVNDEAERLQCLRAADGEIVWEHVWPLPADHSGYVKSAALVGDTIVFGGQDGTVIAFDAASGAQRWTAHIDDAITTSMTVMGNAFFCGGESGTLYRLRRSDGAIEATFDLGKQLFGPPTPMGGAIVQFTEWSDGGPSEVIALAPDLGGVRWRWSLPEGRTGTSARPYRLGSDLLIGTDKGDVIALDLTRGTPTWTFTVEGTVRALRAVGRTLYIGTLQGPLHAVELPEH